MDWIFKEDSYNPPEDKDTFIDKSILSLLNVLSKIQRLNAGKSQRVIYTINPGLKFVSTFLFVLLLSLSGSFVFILAAGVFILAELSLLEREDQRRILSLCLFIPVFTLIMLIPSMLAGNIKNGIMIVLKVLNAVAAVNILSYTTKWHEMTKVLKLFFIPDVFIFVMDVTIRYIYLLGELSLEMVYALKLRMLGKNTQKYRSMSKIIGNLFLKSKEMGDEMCAAMECKGFTGEYQAQANLKFAFGDLLYFSAMVVLALIYLNFKGI